MNTQTWQDYPQGGVNKDAGSSLENFTANYRIGHKPVFNEETCINCFLCWVFCPDNAIMTEPEQVVGINYDYCKGCGICVNECPVKSETKPLEMVEETFLP